MNDLLFIFGSSGTITVEVYEMQCFRADGNYVSE